MIGDLRYFLKKLKKNQKGFKRTLKLFCFEADQINTFSPMEKCKLTITNDGLWLNDEFKDRFCNITKIELIETKIGVSNKGSVIKITSSDHSVQCFSLGGYHFNLSSQLALVMRSNEIFYALKEKWEQNRNKEKKTEDG
ncbi:MAG: hypothetical protein IJ333_00945 [Clostridia bacterium]|nr:hypothetical protein [Clostridia bacterium]